MLVEFGLREFSCTRCLPAIGHMVSEAYSNVALLCRLFLLRAEVKRHIPAAAEIANGLEV